MIDFELGQIVKSTAGRDKDELFIIFEMDDTFIYLVDGKHRRIEVAKKKKKKHVQITHIIAEDIARRLHQSEKITNADIRNSLKDYQQNLE
jgi:ribosomal protein L14E/L6E/L27E